jgi:hypothetical protein
MKEFLASKFLDSYKALESAFEVTTPGKPTDATRRGQIAANIAFVAEQAAILGLRSTVQGANRFLEHCRTDSLNAVHNGIQNVSERFHDDLAGLVFLYLPSDKLAYHQKTELFGDTFKLNFPTANTEVLEAGNCFALGRNTACVFHLMRSLEVVLKTLFQAIGLPPLKTAGERNWNGILRQIREKLDSDKTCPDFDFYDNAYVFLAAAKNPLRNATMHVDVSYDEEGALIVFDAIGAFMRHAATKLKE